MAERRGARGCGLVTGERHQLAPAQAGRARGFRCISRAVSTALRLGVDVWRCPRSVAPQALPCTFTGAWFPGAGWLTDGLVARVAVAAPQVHSQPKPYPALLVYVMHRPGLTDMASPTLSHIITLPTVTPRPQQAGLPRLSVPLGSQGQASLSRRHPSPHRHLCWWAARPHHSVLALLTASGEG